MFYISDEELIILCAFRYILGRRSYIVKTIFDLIQNRLHKISSQTIKIMLRDLSTDNIFKDKCDIECCNEFKKALEKTLQQRENPKEKITLN